MKYALFVAALVASLNVSAQQCRDLETPVKIYHVDPVNVDPQGRRCDPNKTRNCYAVSWYVDWVNEPLRARGRTHIPNGNPAPRVGQRINVYVRQCFQ